MARRCGSSSRWHFDPPGLESPAQQVASNQRHGREDQADHQVLLQRGMQTKQREHQHLRGHRHAIADQHVGHGFHQRYPARLLHSASSASARSMASAVPTRSSNFTPSDSRTACAPAYSCQRRTITSAYFGSSSISRAWRPDFSAAISVVPEPPKGLAPRHPVGWNCGSPARPAPRASWCCATCQCAFET